MSQAICAIDIGSTLCHVLVGRRQSADLIEILGVGTAQSRGVRQGAIINIEAAVQTIEEAVREAELMSGLRVESAWVNVTGKHLVGANSRGVVAIPHKERIITSADVLRVIEGAQNIRIPADQEIMHVLSREFIVDEQSGIKDPVGMTGIRLEADVHIVTAGLTALTNVEKTVSGAGIELSGGVMSSLASAEATLDSSDMELGVALVDIGGGITDILLYIEGGVAYSGTVPLGGMHVTQDLSIGLKIPVEAAEALKKQHGLALSRQADPTQKLELPQVPGRTPRLALHQQIAEIMEARLTELFEMVEHELVKSGHKNALAGGIVLTGGGCLTPATDELASEVIGLGAGIRRPVGVTGFVERVDSPEYSTAVGILHYTNRLMHKPGYHEAVQGGSSSGLMDRLKSWIKNNL